MYHWYVMDIERALECIRETIELSRYDHAQEAFINGYKSEFAIDDEMLSIMPVLIRFANLYSYTRILRATAEKRDNESNWISELIVKLVNLMKSKAVGFGDKL